MSVDKGPGRFLNLGKMKQALSNRSLCYMIYDEHKLYPHCYGPCWQGLEEISAACFYVGRIDFIYLFTGIQCHRQLGQAIVTLSCAGMRTQV